MSQENKGCRDTLAGILVAIPLAILDAFCALGDKAIDYLDRDEDPDGRN